MDIEHAQQLKPFLPSDLAQPDQALIRVATARFITFARNLPAEAAVDVARWAWPRDMTTELLVSRAPVSPTSTMTANVLASQAVGGFVASLAPVHAGARLIAAGLNVPLGTNSSVSLPGVAAYPTAPFVAENDPIPVAAATLTAAVLGPVSRLAVITGATSTLAEVAAESVEATLGALLRESAALALDAGLFSATAGSSSAPFVAENDPIPVAAATLTAAVLGPVSRLAVITGATSTLAEVAAELVEATLGALLRESAALALDAGLFSATAGSSSRPPGLLYGATPITAASGGGQGALLTDLRSLVGAIANAGGGENVWLFAHPGTVIALTLLAGPALYLPVIPTKALPTGTVMAIEVGAFASGFTSVPEISVGREAVLHFDTTPLQIGVAGTPTAPTSSMWQQDLVALRLILRTAWTVRGSGMVQVVNSVTW